MFKNDISKKSTDVNSKISIVNEEEEKKNLEELINSFIISKYNSFNNKTEIGNLIFIKKINFEDNIFETWNKFFKDLFFNFSIILEKLSDFELITNIKNDKNLLNNSDIKNNSDCKECELNIFLKNKIEILKDEIKNLKEDKTKSKIELDELLDNFQKLRENKDKNSIRKQQTITNKEKKFSFMENTFTKSFIFKNENVNNPDFNSLKLENSDLKEKLEDLKSKNEILNDKKIKYESQINELQKLNTYLKLNLGSLELKYYKKSKKNLN